jgi:hypothetical protein
LENIPLTVTRILYLSVLLACIFPNLQAFERPPVTGLCIAAPDPSNVDRFVRFMEEELGPAGINTLVLRVDYNYAYETHPELRDRNPLQKYDVRKLKKAARRTGIRIIPQINLLGHQSWQSTPGRLLEVYPQFDETPSVEFPEKYEWPNPDGLYCKSYCPLHPDIHGVVFDLIDELMDVFEADAFHAGMDEVFYIGMEECPRCRGKDRSELFAGEVNLIREHLAEKGAELWIWGDRLLDGHTSGMGQWEASENDTHRAIDLIGKDVVICDWHYERADPTAAIFALKGYRVVTCPWNRPEVTGEQLRMLDMFRSNSPEEVKDRYMGIMQTVWSPAGRFLDHYYDPEMGRGGDAESLKKIMRYHSEGE